MGDARALLNRLTAAQNAHDLDEVHHEGADIDAAVRGMAGLERSTR
jgi:hypothetical protein